MFTSLVQILWLAGRGRFKGIAKLEYFAQRV